MNLNNIILNNQTQAFSEETANSLINRVTNPHPADFKYFNIGRHWINKIKPVFESTDAQKIMHHDFKRYIKMKQRNLNEHYKSMGNDTRVNWTFKKNDMPYDWDSVDWRVDRFGRPPGFDQYVCHGACHWIVNTLLYTATIAFPKTQWQIITNDEHSTVWDGKYTFFDMNYLALKVPVQYCAEATLLNPDSKFLSAGKYLQCY